MALLVSVDLQQLVKHASLTALLHQIALLAVATHVGPTELSKCGSHGREQIWLLWGWGGCCSWVTFVSLGHCLGPDHRAAFSWVLVEKGRSWADSAQLPSLGFLAINWHQSSHGWGQEFPLQPLSSHMLLPKSGWWYQHLPELSARQAIHLPSRDHQVCCCQWDVPSDLVPCFLWEIYWAQCLLCCLSLGVRVGVGAHTGQGH